jgi:hypothetical protein
MPSWLLWWSALQMVRPAFSRLRTFLWFATAVAGFTVRTELLGVTSIVRALKLRPKCYENYADLRIMPMWSRKPAPFWDAMSRRSA